MDDQRHRCDEERLAVLSFWTLYRKDIASRRSEIASTGHIMVPPSSHSRPALSSVIEGKNDMRCQHHALSSTCVDNRVASDDVALETLKSKIPIS